MTQYYDRAYEIARDCYAAFGVDTEKVLEILKTVSLSIHCWQGDDVGGFEKPGATLSHGGIQATGNFPGKARTINELRQDLVKALMLIPGKHRINLHAIYGEFEGARGDRDEIETGHFRGWIEWAKKHVAGIDFNSTLFSHPNAAAGFTLSSRNPEIRQFWINHVTRCRAIAAEFGKELGSPCFHNLWIPDGSKDTEIDRSGYRQRLKDSLDEIYATRYELSLLRDSVESKLFGIGSESFVVGSHDFYLSYALKNNLMICLDMGHFHPTESVADKISAILAFSNGIVLHISRGVRWDSDHVPVLDDPMSDVAHEIVRCKALDRVHLALDFFDASINRVGAWVTGARTVLKSILIALLEPYEKLLAYENDANLFARLALLEEMKTMPFGWVWDEFCRRQNVPMHEAWIAEIIKYEHDVLRHRK